MINQLINKEDIKLDDIINYIFTKQSAFNTYFKSFPKEIKDIRKQVKKVNNEEIKINFFEASASKLQSENIFWSPKIYKPG